VARGVLEVEPSVETVLEVGVVAGVVTRLDTVVVVHVELDIMVLEGGVTRLEVEVDTVVDLLGGSSVELDAVVADGVVLAETVLLA
jgi:hypothetical protein